MSKVRQRPPRTLPVAALDLVLAGATAIRDLVGRAVRLLPVRRGGRGLAAVVITAALAAVVGTGLLIVALVQAPEQLAPMGVAPPPSPIVEPTGDGAAGDPQGRATPAGASPVAPSPTRAPDGTPTRAADPPGPRSLPPATLAARYATENVTLLNYVGSVTITNPGSGPTDGWTLAITLPRQTQSIREVTGAEASRDGSTWTFVPVQATRQVPAGGSVQVRFRVDGAALDSAPTGCTIDGRPCDANPSSGG